MHIQMAWKVDCRSVLHADFKHSKKRKEYLKIQENGCNIVGMLGVAASVCKVNIHPIDMQQRVQMEATILDIERCWELLANDVTSVCTELKKTWMSNLHQCNPARHTIDVKVIILLVRSVSLQITRKLCWEQITQSTTNHGLLYQLHW